MKIVRLLDGRVARFVETLCEYPFSIDRFRTIGNCSTVHDLTVDGWTQKGLEDHPLNRKKNEQEGEGGEQRASSEGKGGS